MKTYIITDQLVDAYVLWMRENEKSRSTIQKYCHYVRQFQEYADGRAIHKGMVMDWKEELKTELAPMTVNGALAALNSFFSFAAWDSCTVRLIRISRSVFCPEQKELSKEEYRRLIRVAGEKGDERMCLLLQTLCSTGIRVSELPFITVEAVERQCAEVDCKGKVRRIFMTAQLCRMLRDYAARRNILRGIIFVTRNGNPMDRSNIWREMKKLAMLAGVEKKKVFPHNLRHLFARMYYSQEKDLLRLSEVLGHSSIDTTRIYTMESGKSHLRQLEQLDLLAEDTTESFFCCKTLN